MKLIRNLDYHLKSIWQPRSVQLVVLGMIIIYALVVGVSCTTIRSKSFNSNFRVEDTEASRTTLRKCMAYIASEFAFQPYPEFTNRLVAYSSPDGLLSAWAENADGGLSNTDIAHYESLAFKLKQPHISDNVSLFLRTKLPSETLDLLSNYRGGTNLKLNKALRMNLSRIIYLEPSIYDPKRFSGVKLSAETVRQLELRPQGRELFRLNRMLLDDAYPEQIRRMKKNSLLINFMQVGKTKSKRHVEIQERLTQTVESGFGDDLWEISSHDYLLP